MITAAIDRGDAYAALGFLYAREFLQQGLDEDFWLDKTITTAWIHLDIAPRLDEILAEAPAVVVITGRHELESEFSARLGSRLRAFLSIPVQGFLPSDLSCSHYGNAFPKVRQILQAMDLSGTLVLIGAGLFGKIYCQVAKDNGGVALDLGSTFDAMAGFKTRPIHDAYNVQSMRWITR